MNKIYVKRKRNMAVAGTFYPKNANDLSNYVERMISASSVPPHPPLAVISPHAGYSYSGVLTARALSATRAMTVTSVVVLSPSHKHNFEGLALPSAGIFKLPATAVPVDVEAARALVKAGLAHVDDAAHDREHGIEVQLPFLRQLHPDAELVPLVIGRTSIEDVAKAIDFLATFRDTPPLFVLSSDLSHYLTLNEAREKDAATAKLIETGKTNALTAAHACGHAAISGFFASRFGQGRRLSRLSMANSFDHSKNDEKTVGYGAWTILQAEASTLSESDRNALLSVARQALEIRAHQGTLPKVDMSTFSPQLQTHAASFVTLTHNGRLRGCIGSLIAHRPLVLDVAVNAIKAGFDDYRFKPLNMAELSKIDIKIALLSPPRPLEFSSEADLVGQLQPGRDGLILREGSKTGVFLPMVWDKLPSPQEFLNGLKLKAGLPKDHWSDDLVVEHFVTETFTAAQKADADVTP